MPEDNFDQEILDTIEDIPEIPIESTNNLPPGLVPGDWTKIKANEGQQITCNGMIYYGRKQTPNGDDITDLNKLKEYSYGIVVSSGEKTCNVDTMGSDPLPNVEKQCMCLAETSTTEAFGNVNMVLYRNRILRGF